MLELFQQAAAAHQRGDLRAAEAAYRSLLAGSPNFHPAWHGLGVLAHQARQHRVAIDLIRRALALAPDTAAYLNNLGNALKAAGDFSAAVEQYRRALALAPELNSARNNLGNALQAMGDIDGATIALEQAVAQAPDDARVMNNLANLYKEQGRLDEALAAYEKAAENPNFLEPRSNFLAALKLSVKHAPEQVFDLHREAGRRLEAALLADYQPLQNTADAERRLTVGYVSPDCHPAVPAFIGPVLRAHDHARFRVICYTNNPQPVESNSAAVAHIESRVIGNLPDQQVCQLIRDDGVDILVDIAGHTGINRLGVFAARSAPIQLTWLDYLNTTGLTSMDYRLTDSVADPPAKSEHVHSETLWRLPDTQWCWKPPQSTSASTALPAAAHGHVTFGSFNNYSKLTDATLVLWSRLLAHLPGTRLLLVGVAPGTCQQRVRRMMGVAESRLEFAPRVPVDEYRSLYGKVDIALDPFPFSGATTTLDALWEGVPVLTIAGPFSASRSSASILSCLGLNDWIAADEDELIALAAAKIADLPALAQLRAGLRARLQASALTDIPRFVENLENAYRSMWRVWCETTLPLVDHASPTAPKTMTQRELDLMLAEAQAQLRQRNVDRAIALLLELTRQRQGWRAALRELAQAMLIWARSNPEAIAHRFAAMEADSDDARRISVIVCSIKPEKFARVSENLRLRLGTHLLEIIAIHDASSLCEGYNRGARGAKGEILIFCHDDIELVSPDFAARLLRHLRHVDGVGVCGTTRLTDGDWNKAGQPWVHGQVVHRKLGEDGFILLVNGAATERAQAWDGLFFAVRREVWERVRFDEQTFDGFHLYDVDFSFRAYLEGFNLALVTDLLLIHDSMGRYDGEWRRYNRRFREKFAQQLAAVPDNIPGALNCKLQTLEQVDLLRAGLIHFDYGAARQ